MSTVNPRQERKPATGFVHTLLHNQMGYIRTGPAFSKKDLCYAPSRCSEPFKSPCLYMESQKYQGSYSACPTPRFKSRSTNLKDLLFAWRKEFCGRESRDSSVAYQQPDPGQGSHLTSLHFRLLAGETGKLTRDANLHERYSADESHRTRGHGGHRFISAPLTSPRDPG